MERLLEWWEGQWKIRISALTLTGLEGRWYLATILTRDTAAGVVVGNFLATDAFAPLQDGNFFFFFATVFLLTARYIRRSYALPRTFFQRRLPQYRRTDYNNIVCFRTKTNRPTTNAPVSQTRLRSKSTSWLTVFCTLGTEYVRFGYYG